MTDSLRAAGLAIAAALLLPALPAHAERADRDKPLVLEADNASYDDLKQVYHLTGNVVLTKGTMVLRSDEADLRTDPEGYNYAIATSKPGNLAFIRQKRDNVDEYIQGWGERIEYDGKQEISKLITRARMERLQGATQLDEIRCSKTKRPYAPQLPASRAPIRAKPSSKRPGPVSIVVILRRHDSEFQPRSSACAGAADLRHRSASRTRS